MIDSTPALQAAAALLREVVHAGQPIAALTGAGVSAESGIPTFRGAGGLWKGFRAEELATPEAFRRDPEKVWEWYQWRRGIVLDAQPNAGHRALAKLQRVHERFTLITQNVDGLHQRAGSTRVIELHGNIHYARCTDCDHVARLPTPGTDPEVQPPSYVPTCDRCGAATRPHIVWFGETLPPKPWEDAYAAAVTAGLLLVVGTSAAVYPAAGLVDITLNGGGSVIEINPEETTMSDRVTHGIRKRAGAVLPKLLAEVGFTDHR